MMPSSHNVSDRVSHPYSTTVNVIFTGKPTEYRPFGRPRRRWEDNIRMDLEEIGINAGNWVDSAQDRNY